MDLVFGQCVGHGIEDVIGAGGRTRTCDLRIMRPPL
jgi:hypothetical protein